MEQLPQKVWHIGTSWHIYVLGLGILAVLVAGIYITTLYKNSDTETPNTTGEPTLSTEEELALQAQAGEIIKTKDFGGCDAIQNQMYRSVCINNIALNLSQETGDISYCLKLDDKLVPIAECERQIVSKQSIEKEDKAICQTATDEAVVKECEESYLFGLAGKKQDPSICDQEPDKTKADQCWNMYHVQKTLLHPGLQGAGTSPSLNCSVLRGVDAKADCTLMNEVKKDNNPQAIQQSCQNLKTPLFLQICMMSQMQQGRPGVPGMPGTSSL